MSFEAWKEGHVAASECQLDIVAPPANLKREAVSPRLRQTLVHSEQSGILAGPVFSADGRRLFAIHRQSGVIQVWDAVTGRQQTRIETARPHAMLTDYLQPSPDGQSLFVNAGIQRIRPITDKEKRMWHVESSGGVRQWNAENGKPLRDFQSPGLGVSSLELSADGSKLLTFEIPSGDFEKAPQRLATLWDVKSGRRLVGLPEKLGSFAFSSDSKTIVAYTWNGQQKRRDLQFLDVATGMLRRSFPIQEKPKGVLSRPVLSPDGKCAAYKIFDQASGVSWLEGWDVESGRKIVSVEREKGRLFSPLVFSPDGSLLAATTYNGGKELYLIEVKKGSIRKKINLGEGYFPQEFAFSPDSKWIAAISQPLSRDTSLITAKADNLPQPRILLIESATGEVRETLVAPPGIAVSLCFSPDGKTLASGGDGRVLLWDMTKPPGTQAPSADVPK